MDEDFLQNKYNEQKIEVLSFFRQNNDSNLFELPNVLTDRLDKTAIYFQCNYILRIILMVCMNFISNDSIMR